MGRFLSFGRVRCLMMWKYVVVVGGGGAVPDEVVRFGRLA